MSLKKMSVIGLAFIIVSCKTCPVVDYTKPSCPTPYKLVIEQCPEVETDIEYIDRIRNNIRRYKAYIAQLKRIIKCYEDNYEESKSPLP